MDVQTSLFSGPQSWCHFTDKFSSLLMIFFTSTSTQAFVDQVKTSEMNLLEQRLTDSVTRLCFLVDHTALSPLHTRLNAQTIQWFRRMPSIFNEHQQIVDNKAQQFQVSLQVCVSASSSVSARSSVSFTGLWTRMNCLCLSCLFVFTPGVP